MMALTAAVQRSRFPAVPAFAGSRGGFTMQSFTLSMSSASESLRSAASPACDRSTSPSSIAFRASSAGRFDVSSSWTTLSSAVASVMQVDFFTAGSCACFFTSSTVLTRKTSSSRSSGSICSSSMNSTSGTPSLVSCPSCCASSTERPYIAIASSSSSPSLSMTFTHSSLVTSWPRSKSAFASSISSSSASESPSSSESSSDSKSGSGASSSSAITQSMKSWYLTNPSSFLSTASNKSFKSSLDQSSSS
mmetsp:Transcript_24955/g.70272  ORF Transcript_24955/g.70272 Transcript_24955/m.70272 type:complete len:249 (-) Transcript_24955:184-930(-)